MTKPIRPLGSYVWGWVYLAETKNGVSKLGFSSRLDRRIDALRHGSERMTLVAHSRLRKRRNAWGVEQALHAEMASSRLEGELYRLTEEQKSRILSVFTGKAKVTPIFKAVTPRKKWTRHIWPRSGIQITRSVDA